MLKLKKIKKSYKTGDFVQHALKGIDLEFRKNEFVAVLGPSGSGKTTLLNIIGGLDRYDSGNLIINGKSTRDFKLGDWDSYRNNCIGFIFQSYNLINHISVLENVEMGMTLSGISSKERKRKALQVLKKVGLKEHAHKKPNQLSGGQMQRVAIARALANDPEIILADEPTGALDSKTSVQIMELISEIAKDKLVIMVTHNPELASKYASRIVEFKDGELVSDSNPISEADSVDEVYNIKKTSMNYFTALKLSFNNIKTKKGRTILTAFASSIGIIGIALILSLSNGFKIQIDKFEKDTLSQAPIIISEQAMDFNSMSNFTDTEELEDYPSDEKIRSLKTVQNMVHTNNITSEYIDLVSGIDENLIGGISYQRATAMNVLVKIKDKVKMLPSSVFASMPSGKNGSSSIMDDNFEIISGSYPKNKEDLVLLVDSKNRVDESILEALGFKDDVDFSSVVGMEFKLALNNEYYKKFENLYTVNTNLDKLYNNDNLVTLRISGIMRGKEGSDFAKLSGTGLMYNESLMDYIIDKNNESDIVKVQKKSDYNVLTTEKFDLSSDEGVKARDMVLSYLGAESEPLAIQIYPNDFDSKDEILSVLDSYNENKDDKDKIIYMDQAKLITTASSSIMDAITIVLIAFSGISLVVSSIMIGIITYISVLERTKEIGILRALGARRKDITRVFNAETIIIGFTSGVIGLIITRGLIIPINVIIKELTDLSGVAKLNPVHGTVLLIISVVLTLIGGFIPAKLAAKKDPVEALRSE